MFSRCAGRRRGERFAYTPPPSFPIPPKALHDPSHRHERTAFETHNRRSTSAAITTLDAPKETSRKSLIIDQGDVASWAKIIRDAGISRM